MAHTKKKVADLESLLAKGIAHLPTVMTSITDVKNEWSITDLVAFRSHVEQLEDTNNSALYQPVYQTIEKELSLRSGLENIAINDLFSSLLSQDYSLADTLKRVNLYTRYHREELDVSNLEQLKAKMRDAYFAKEERTKEDLSQYRSAVATINAVIQKKNKNHSSLETNLRLTEINLNSSGPTTTETSLPFDSPIFTSYSKEEEAEDWVGLDIEDNLTDDEREAIKRPMINPEDLIVHPEIVDGFTEDSYCSEYNHLHSFDMLELPDLKKAMDSVDTIYQERFSRANFAEKRALIDANNDIKANLRNLFYDYGNTIFEEVRTSLKESSLTETKYDHHIEQLASLQEASSTFDVQETVRRKELQQEAVALALQLSEKYTPLEQKKPAHYPRQLHPLRWAFAGLGSILLLNTAYSLVASNDVFGSEINTEVDSSYSGNNPGKNPNNNFDDKKRVSSHSESPASSKKLVTSQLPRAGSFHYVTPHSTAQPTDEQTEDSNAVEQNSEQVSREYTVKSGDSLISIATKEYCSNLTGKKKGHCGVDTGMALGQWNHKIGRNGGISLHPKDQLNLPSEATLRSYVRSHERGLHHQFEKVRQYYGRR